MTARPGGRRTGGVGLVDVQQHPVLPPLAGHALGGAEQRAGDAPAAPGGSHGHRRQVRIPRLLQTPAAQLRQLILRTRDQRSGTLGYTFFDFKYFL